MKATLTTGKEVYPRREDLASLPFWKCESCNNFVGCHHQTKNPTKPLGCIATQEIKNARKHIHKILDPIWQSKRMKRKEIYDHLSLKLGWQYHTANIRSIKEARKVWKLVRELSLKLDKQ